MCGKWDRLKHDKNFVNVRKKIHSILELREESKTLISKAAYSQIIPSLSWLAQMTKEYLTVTQFVNLLSDNDTDNCPVID